MIFLGRTIVPLRSDESRTDWWGDLSAPMKAAIEQFRTRLGAAIDSVDPVKRALETQVPENDRGETLNTALR
ncbi:MAG: hypothetical protein E6G75_08550 [Alphaproteobacteria bacterium]|nr:MAG: hypothetical protein E6G75_08550 [Alphaproteobacteria bacterium]